MSKPRMCNFSGFYQYIVGHVKIVNECNNKSTNVSRFVYLRTKSIPDSRKWKFEKLYNVNTTNVLHSCFWHSVFVSFDTFVILSLLLEFIHNE